MNNRSPADDIEARARRRVRIKTGFYTHALVFVLVNLGLFALNSVIGGYRWSVWPLAGWGLGLAVHGIVTLLSLQGEGWRQRMLADEIERLQRNRP
jgi:fatty acid desaturase